MHLLRCKKWLAVFFLILMIVLATNPAAFATQGDHRKKVIFVVIDGVSFDDFAASAEKLPNFKRLMELGGIGLMNTNTGGRRASDCGYLTIGAGARAIGADGSGLGFNVSEKYGESTAGNFFSHATGVKIKPGNLVHLDIAELTANNVDKDYGAVPGTLGSILHAHGLRTAVFGNGDADESWRRYGVALAMDQSGIVDGGLVSPDVLRKDPKNPFGIGTNYSLLLKEYPKVRRQYDFIVYDLADISRLEANSQYFTAERLKTEKRKMLYKADLFIGGLLKGLDRKNTMLVVVSPTTSKEGLKNASTFTPLFIVGSKVSPGEMLISGSTRRPGIVVNTDLAPTVLSFYGIASPELAGREIISVAGKNVLERLTVLNQTTVFTTASRLPVVQGYVILQIIVLLGAIISAFFSGSLYHHIGRCLKWLLVWLTTVPFVLLILPLFTVYLFIVNSLTIEVLLIIGLSTVLTLVLTRIGKHPLTPFTVMALATLALILGDTLIGCPLAKFSTLSYDPMVGARFYGIGNEFEGVVAGSFIVGYVGLYELYPQFIKLLKALGLPLILGTGYVLAAPNLGADVGGTIVTILGLGFTYLLLLNKRLTIRQLITLGVILLAVLAGMVTVELLRPTESQSHLGRLAQAVESQGFIALWSIIQRKVAMNLKLIRYTKWSLVLLTSLAGLAVFYYRPVGLLRKILQRYPYLRRGFIGSAAAGATAFLFNDSGVVAAATLNIFPITLLITLIMVERGKEKEISLRGEKE